MRDTLGNMRERAGDNEAAVGKSDQHDVVEILVQHVIDHVADMGAEAHQRTGKVYPFTNPRQARRRHVVAFGAKQPAHMSKTV